jgi:hypothetical protein
MNRVPRAGGCAARERGNTPNVGALIYGTTGLTIDIEDRTLAHLQIVMVAKLRRSEGFLFTWREGGTDVDARRSVWVHPAIPLQFAYSDRVVPEISRAWIDALSITSHSAGGLRIVPEPAPPSR